MTSWFANSLAQLPKLPALDDLIQIIIVVVVVVIAPLANALIKYFSRKPEGRIGPPVERERSHPTRPTLPRRLANRPIARPLPPDRMPIPPAMVRRSVAKIPPLEVVETRVETIRVEKLSPPPTGRDTPDEHEVHLPEILLEMLGVPKESVRPPNREPRPPRPEKHRESSAEAKTRRSFSAPPRQTPPPPPARRVPIARGEADVHVSIHDRLPSEKGKATAVPSRSDRQPGTGPRDMETVRPRESTTATVAGLGNFAKVGKHQLRRAVVWNEILGPPVGLRGD